MTGGVLSASLKDNVPPLPVPDAAAVEAVRIADLTAEAVIAGDAAIDAVLERGVARTSKMQALNSLRASLVRLGLMMHLHIRNTHGIISSFV